MARLVDVCVVLYRCDASRVEAGLRPGDRLIAVDNTRDNRGFAAGCNLAAARGSAELVCFVNPDGDLAAGCLDWLERAFEDPTLVAAGPNVGRMNQALLEDGSPSFLSGCCLAVRRSAFPFAHGARHALRPGLVLFDSFHCSRYNTNTGKLTPAMFRAVLRSIRDHVDAL